MTLFGGKFNPGFGVAWDLAPGIYGADFADDDELTERIGLGGALTLDGGNLGRHTLTGQTFYTDTSVLSQSWGTQRGRTRETDGGAGNTGTLESFSATVDGEVPQTIDGLRYQVGFERQQHGRRPQPHEDGERAPAENEWGAAAALYGSFELAADIDIEPVLEAAWIRNLAGEPNTVSYLTAGGGSAPPPEGSALYLLPLPSPPIAASSTWVIGAVL